MRILAAIPHTRRIPQCVDSINALKTGGHEVMMWWITDGDDPGLHRYQNITHKLQRAQDVVIAQRYDALLCLDDDQVYPVDLIPRLVALDADVAYGLTVWRNAPHRWTAVTEIDGDHYLITADMRQDTRLAFWGQQRDVRGCGTFGTLIRRRVLESVPFDRRGPHCNDWYLSLDCIKYGFSQRADLALLIGHWTEQGVLWPTPEGWRIDDHH